jgi:hypothetical protein
MKFSPLSSHLIIRPNKFVFRHKFLHYPWHIAVKYGCLYCARWYCMLVYFKWNILTETYQEFIKFKLFLISLWRRKSVISIVTRLRNGRSGVHIPAWAKNFYLTKTSTPALQRTHPPTHYVLWVFFLRFYLAEGKTLVPRYWISRAIRRLPLYTFLAHAWIIWALY